MRTDTRKINDTILLNIRLKNSFIVKFPRMLISCKKYSTKLLIFEFAGTAKLASAKSKIYVHLRKCMLIFSLDFTYISMRFSINSKTRKTSWKKGLYSKFVSYDCMTAELWYFIYIIFYKFLSFFNYRSNRIQKPLLC